MPEISVVMPVYNAERFLEDTMNSILNQTFDDLEFICVDDGSSDGSLDILHEFSKKDPRVKVFSLNHEGGGNARNFGLKQVSGKYLYLMDADDLLYLNAFEDFYALCEEKNLDFLVFKATNYGVEKDHYFETEYQNMTSISNLVKDNVFDYSDLGDLLFDFNVSPWCKFYNSEFIKNSGAQFRENSKFHDNQFFWDIIFQAKRIYFVNEFYYTRKRYGESLTSSGDEGHINIIGVVNDIIKLFIKHGQLDNYKNKLYNFKIKWITDRYNQIQEQYKGLFFTEMKKDYESLKKTEFESLLNPNSKFIFNNVLLSKDYMEFDLINDYNAKKKQGKIDVADKKIEKKISRIKGERTGINKIAFKSFQKTKSILKKDKTLVKIVRKVK